MMVNWELEEVRKEARAKGFLGDSDFKRMMRLAYGESVSIKRFNADYVYAGVGRLVAFECENSQRGLVANLIKHICQAKRISKKIDVVFIKGSKHKSKSDERRFLELAGMFHLPNNMKVYLMDATRLVDDVGSGVDPFKLGKFRRDSKEKI